jgi:hypothetical protein
MDFLIKHAKNFAFDYITESIHKARTSQIVQRQACAGQSGIRFPTGARDVSVLQSVQIGWGYRRYFFGNTAAVSWKWPAACSGGVKNEWNCTYTPPYAFVSRTETVTESLKAVASSGQYQSVRRGFRKNFMQGFILLKYLGKWNYYRQFLEPSKPKTILIH